MDTKKLRQKILDLAIHGKLVPQDPNDEPASVLLERIKAEKEQLIKEGKIKRQKKSASSDTSHYGNDVPFEVPEGWVWISGKDLFLPMRSTSPSGEKFSYIDIDAIDNKKNIAFPKLILTESAPSRASRYTQYGDTLFSMVRPYLKNIAKVTTEHCIASTGFYICHPYSNINADFIFYLMTSDYVVDGLNSFIKGDNSPSISSRDIDGWKFPLPPVAEQQRIVNEIKRYFSIISTIENEEVALKDSVKKAKSKVLELALCGKLTSDTSHYPKLPEGWGNKDFSQLFEVLTSKSYQIQQKEIHQSGKYPVISQSALYIEGYSDIEEKLYNAETPVIIFGDHTRNVKYVNFDFIVGADGVKILKPTINSKFAYYLTLYNSKQIENRGYSRHFQYLKQQSWSIPSEKEQQKIVEIIEHYFRVFDIIITELGDLRYCQ